MERARVVSSGSLFRLGSCIGGSLVGSGLGFFGVVWGCSSCLVVVRRGFLGS